MAEKLSHGIGSDEKERKERKECMKDLRAKGLPYRKIGMMFGISGQRVHQLLMGKRFDYSKVWEGCKGCSSEAISCSSCSMRGTQPIRRFS